ncbi:unnamed protein product [Peronospora effusa]|nr:unnamed protein product [Peronospora effusa]
MGLPTPTMKIVFKGSEAVSQAASGGESKKELDTPGIEPGAFRLQSGRATTALCAQQLHIKLPQYKTRFFDHIRTSTRTPTLYTHGYR